jgi:hypothetical protein
MSGDGAGAYHDRRVQEWAPGGRLRLAGPGQPLSSRFNRSRRGRSSSGCRLEAKQRAACRSRASFSRRGAWRCLPVFAVPCSIRRAAGSGHYASPGIPFELLGRLRRLSGGRRSVLSVQLVAPGFEATSGLLALRPPSLEMGPEGLPDSIGLCSTITPGWQGAASRSSSAGPLLGL